VKKPMTQVLVYLIVGAGAVAVALVFILTREAMMLDWAILGLGLYAIYRGVADYLALRRGPGGDK
jgi:uncharacterized membrane protein